jgi:hypothetical protein
VSCVTAAISHTPSSSGYGGGDAPNLVITRGYFPVAEPSSTDTTSMTCSQLSPISMMCPTDDRTAKKLWLQSAVSCQGHLGLWGYRTHPDRYRAL